MSKITLRQLLKLREPGFTEEIGIEFTKAENSCAEGRILIEKRHLNPSGTVHGGCIFSLMDALAGVAASSGGNRVATSSSNVLFLNAAADTNYIKAFAKPIKLGKTLQVFDVEVLDDADRLIAKANITVFILGSIDGDI